MTDAYAQYSLQVSAHACELAYIRSLHPQANVYYLFKLRRVLTPRFHFYI
jgi:hypothetical protein